MHDTIKAREYVPHLYKDFVEMDALIHADDTVLDIAEAEVRKLRNNQWLALADEDGIKQWEDMLQIVANPAEEDLEFRRQRLINRISSRIPFTKFSLEEKLDSIIGAGNYVLTIDNNQCIIYLESSASNQLWYTEILLTMNNMKPCNMLFINSPFVNFSVAAEETINYSEKINNYTLGSGFKLGMKPFVTYRDEVVVKLGNVKSIQPQLLTEMATFAAGDIASVLINDSVTITTFVIKEAASNVATISYDVSASQASEITNVKLRNAAGDVLSSANVYVPVSDVARMKHTITVKEG